MQVICFAWNGLFIISQVLPSMQDCSDKSIFAKQINDSMYVFINFCFQIIESIISVINKTSKILFVRGKYCLIYIYLQYMSISTISIINIVQYIFNVLAFLTGFFQLMSNMYWLFWLSGTIIRIQSDIWCLFLNTMFYNQIVQYTKCTSKDFTYICNGDRPISDKYCCAYAKAGSSI